MSAVTQHELELAICPPNRCWLVGVVDEAGVRAELGSHWKALLLDRHFSACVQPNHRVGGLCDAVAVYPQESNTDLRLVELKQSVDDAPNALPQLQKGGELVANALPARLDGLNVTAEIHVRWAPRTTTKYRNTIDVGARRVRVFALRDGRQV